MAAIAGAAERRSLPHDDPDLQVARSESAGPPPDAAEAVRILQALNSSPDALIVLDAGGFVTWASSATAQVLGWSSEALVGRSISVMALEENVAQQQELLDQLRRTGRAATFTAQRRHGDGRIVEVAVSMAPIRDADTGAVAGTCASVRDASQQTRLQTQLAEQEHVSLTLNRRSSDISLIANTDTVITFISPSVVDVLGFTPEQIVGSRGLALVHDDDLAAVQDFVGRVSACPGAVERLTFRVTDARGEWRWIEQTLSNCFDVPVVQGLVANVRDVTNEVEARAALTASERRYRTIVETAQEGVLVLDHDTRVLFANGKASEILGHARSKLYRRKLTAFVDSATAADMRRRSASRSRRGHERYETIFPHPDGRDRVLEVAASPISLDADGATGSLAMISDVTEARRVASELQHRALHDALTGLPNRALFDDRLAMALSRQSQEGDHPGVAVLSFDLDGFKLVNDVYGHALSDAILIEVADRLRRHSRHTDTVARLGSDEFVVVTEGVDADAAVALAEHLREALLEAIVTGDTAVYVDASVGVALTPAVAPSRLLKAADAALHQAKMLGRGRVHVYDESCDTDTARRLRVGAALREALAADELTMGYQPVVDLAQGRVVAVEALLRWRHPDLGLVPPPEIVATAHAIGLAETLDRHVLRRACSDMAQMRDRGACAGITLAVNLSAQSFDSRLPQKVSDACRLTGWPLSQTSLEITESVLMTDPQATSTVLTDLLELDVAVAIDDFGTGYSSLAYLKRLPVAALKVDRSFVEHVPADPESCAIVRSITDLANALSLTTIAEGIESQEQADHMRALGCTYGQGFLWSPAVPRAELEELLRTWPR